MQLKGQDLSYSLLRHFDNPEIVAEAQSMIDENKSMLGLDTKNLDLRMQERGPI